MPMLLIIAFVCVGGAVFVLSEAATYPARLKARSVKRASEWGLVRVPRNEKELVHFRERVLAPAAQRLAAIPLKLSPKTNVEAIGRKLVAAGLAQRISVHNFLTIKGGTTVAGCIGGVLIATVGSFASVLLFVPVLGVLGMIAPDFVLNMKIRSRRETIRAELPDALDLLAVSVEAGLGFDGAVTKLTEHMDGPLIDEFALMLSEIRVGEARSVALRKMAERVDAV